MRAAARKFCAARSQEMQNHIARTHGSPRLPQAALLERAFLCARITTSLCEFCASSPSEGERQGVRAEIARGHFLLRDGPGKGQLVCLCSWLFGFSSTGCAVR